MSVEMSRKERKERRQRIKEMPSVPVPEAEWLREDRPNPGEAIKELEERAKQLAK